MNPKRIYPGWQPDEGEALVLVAGSRTQAQYWAQEMFLGHRWAYASSINARGRSPLAVLFCGTWSENPRLLDVMESVLPILTKRLVCGDPYEDSMEAILAELAMKTQRFKREYDHARDTEAQARKRYDMARDARAHELVSR